MNAIVLIGGFGTRLRPITYQVPKQLIPIAGKPMLYHVLDLLPPEVDEAIFATGYLQEVLRSYVEQHPPKVKVRCISEATPLGTAGGMRNAGEDASDPFLLLNSDVIAQIDVKALIAFHREKGGMGCMSLSEVEDTRPYGVAALEPDLRISGFVEKPAPEVAPSHWINAGVQIWRREVLDRIPKGQPMSFETQVIPGLLPKGIYGFQSRGFWEDAGTPARLLNAQRLLFDHGRAVQLGLPEEAKGRGKVASLEGVSARGALLGPYVHLGNRVTIGAGAEVENSVIMDGASIGAGAVVRDSVVGPGSSVAPKTRLTGQVVGVAHPQTPP
jgi:mannose-1-phosphate guanylyltransferase